jgi:hypothetical protein
MFATPIAYLIDEARTIAQEVAVSAEPILKPALTGTSPPRQFQELTPSQA